MIIFFEDGRLGNQLFQYAALSKLYPSERLIFFGCGELKHVLSSSDAIILEKGSLPRWLMFGIRCFILLLARLRIIGTIQETRKNAVYAINRFRGIVVGVCILKSSYFQHQKLLDGINPAFALRSSLRWDAMNWLKSRVTRISEMDVVFVHIRRGDYLAWPSREFPAVLDLHWYLNAMIRMRSIVDNPLFIVLTDDLYYARDCFEGQKDVIVSDNNCLIDFALMSLCVHGILSPSSFAWWGAWFSKKHSHGAGTFLAPRYWGGHRKKEWIPEGFFADWITYVE